MADDELAEPKRLAAKLLQILETDRDEHLLRIDDYIRGNHDDPYMPEQADSEYKLLAKRAVSNWMPLIISTPAQAMYVDSFRRGSKSTDNPEATAQALLVQPEWDHWQESRLDSRQSAIYRGAIGYGHSFTVTEMNDDGRPITRGLSPLRTTAVFDDPANDIVPVAAIHVTKFPVDGDPESIGKAILWNESTKHNVTFKALNDPNGITVDVGEEGDSEECPVTRFAAHVDLNGRTTGVVEPAIPLQNRINQTVFDLLVAQTYSSFKVRWISGMAPPLKTEPIHEDEDDPDSPIIGARPVFDSNGQPIARDININAKRVMFAEDHEAKFGTLDESPLDGFISSIDMSVKHLSATTQTPPHHLLGQIANLSAEALQAAEVSLQRMVSELQSAFGESWERVFRLAAEMLGDLELAKDYAGEAIWRDMEQRSLSQSADALGKMTDQLGIPKRGLWPRVPNVTAIELAEWTKLANEEDSQLQLADALNRATAPPEEPLNDSLPTGGSGSGQQGLSASAA